MAKATGTNIEVTGIRCRATAGSPISLALRDALVLSATEGRAVELIHNDFPYKLDYMDYLEQVHSQRDVKPSE